MIIIRNMLDIKDIKGLKIEELLVTYEGKNPYINYIKKKYQTEKYYFLTTKWTGKVNVNKPNPHTGLIEHDDYRWATIEQIKDLDNSEIPIYLLEKALEMSKNERSLR